MKIAEALSVNKSIRELDLRDNCFNNQVGLAITNSMLVNTERRIRKIDVSENDFPPDIVSSIEATMSFSPSVWCGQNLQEALLEASSLCPGEHVKLFDLPDYLGAMTRFWKEEEDIKHIMAALHAPIATLRHIDFHRGPRPDGVEYKADRISFLARMYAPSCFSGRKLALPSGRISTNGCSFST
jgi:hypothetical protein